MVLRPKDTRVLWSAGALIGGLADIAPLIENYTRV